VQKITPCLWFNNNGEEAARFYVTLFKRSKIGRILKYDAASAEASGMPKGSVLTVELTLAGQELLILNGGPIFKLSEATSFMIDCKDQKEVDFYWNKLRQGGQEMPCGWVKDRFGLTWQVVPSMMNKWIMDKNLKKAQATMRAMLTMKKLDIAKLKKAHDGK
jgi:predicted 3-demethylubiquinone-9 3-methyltransferase (glyoxalase superfamily)